MKRRDFVKTGMCLLGCGWSCAPLLAREGKGETSARTEPVAAPLFPLKLEPTYARSFDTLRYWLHCMLERLGQKTTLGIWQQAFRKPAGELTGKILADGWTPRDPVIARSSGPDYPASIEGMTREQAVALCAKAPNLAAMKARFPDLHVQRQSTSVDAMHLAFDDVARLATELIRTLGKQGELVAYDIVRSLRIYRASLRPQEVADFLKQFSEFAKATTPNLFTAGLEMQIVKATDTEFIGRITRCAWAEYFRKHHPHVGYLLSCSTDDADYRTVNPVLRMQRTRTLMEGGENCDFRIYSIATG